MKVLHRYKTMIGVFYIGTEGNMYYPIYDDRNLGTYNTAQRQRKIL